MNEQQYTDGFNRGYVIAKHEPVLVSKITIGLSQTNDFLSGFFSGKEEWELEHNRIKLDELKQLRNQFKNRDQELEK